MSKPDDIPQDVWKTAGAVLDGYLYGSMSPDETIARVILAERERCASACDPFDKPPSTSNFVNGQSTAAQQIRGAIRKGAA